MKIKLVINYKIPLNKNIIIKTQSEKKSKKKIKKSKFISQKNILNQNCLLEYDLETKPKCNINYSLINSLPKF